MRKIEVRLTGKNWVDSDRSHAAHSVQITSNGDLVILGVGDKPVGETPDGQVVYSTKIQHGYAAGTWAEFNDGGEIEGLLPGEKAN